MQKWACAFGAANQQKTAQHTALNAWISLTGNVKEKGLNMRMHNNPCRYCDKRTAECHAGCQEYAEAKAKHDKIIKEQNKVKQTQQDIVGIKKRRFK